jgi:transcriptional regulator with XRE-family HTH domain
MMGPLGANIKAARTAKNMTVDQLAAEVGVSPRLVQKWQQGVVKPRYENLLKLAAALDRDPAWFYAEHSNDDEPVAA